MKKTICFLKICTIVLLVAILAFVVCEYRQLRYFYFASKPEAVVGNINEISDGEMDEYQEDMARICRQSCLIDKNLDNEEGFAEILSVLPDCVKRIIKETGLEFVVITDDEWFSPQNEYLESHESNTSSVATYDKQENIIYVAESYKYNRETVLHEVGHMIDKYLGYVSYDSEFFNIKETEYDGSLMEWNSYFYHNEEYFAEAFSHYFLVGSQYAEEIKEYESAVCPQTCNFIEKVIASLDDI